MWEVTKILECLLEIFNHTLNIQFIFLQKNNQDVDDYNSMYPWFS